jgi:hypothetical protein
VTISDPLKFWPPVAMTDDNHRTVRCLLQDDDASFKVSVPLSADVGDLKTAIRKDGFGEMSTVLAKDLVLYKVGLVQCPQQTNCSSHGDILTGRCRPSTRLVRATSKSRMALCASTRKYTTRHCSSGTRRHPSNSCGQINPQIHISPFLSNVRVSPSGIC